MDHEVDEINLNDYTLKNFTPSKLSSPTLEVIFLNEVKKSENRHINGQLKSVTLTFPFVKNGFLRPCSIMIKSASILVDAELTRGVKEVVELVLDATPLSGLDYSPGNTIAILPQNLENEASFLLEKIELLDKADMPCNVQALQNSSKKVFKFPHIPDCTSPRELLRDILNIRSFPKKQFLRALGNCCTSKDEENFLNCLASKEGSHFYNELFWEKGLTLLELLNLCGSCKPTLSLFIEHLPRLLPRPYSIANSPLSHENEVKIIFSVLNKRPGVTTCMLSSMAKDVIQRNHIKPPTVLLYPREINKFCYNDDDYRKNQVLIAIGTGLAPFLGFLEHKECLFKKNEDKSGSTWLFVGATVEEAVPHRKKIMELIEKHENHVIERYFESFSRVPDTEFHYIQEQFIAHAQELVEFILNNETTLYVCADGARISQAIESSLCLCLQKELEITPDAAKDMLKQFRTNEKYREDLWT